MSLLKFFRYLRLHPFPNASEEGRNAERYRRALWTVLCSFAARGMNLIAMIISVSVTLPYLGAERFGAWMTVASLATMLSFLDLGIGYALTNRVAKAASTGNQHTLRTVISGGLGVLGILSVALLVLLFMAASFLPWVRLIKFLSPEVAEEVRRTTMLFSVLFAASTFTNGVSRVMFGLQRGFAVHLAGLLGSLAGLISVGFSATLHAGLPVLLACTMGGAIVANGLLFIVLVWEDKFGFSHLMLRIRSEASQVLGSGGLFFLLQIGTMVALGADSFIIANATGAASVAAYALTYRLSLFVSQPLALVNAPLWAAYADASSRNELSFIRNAFRRSILITFSLSSVGALLLIYFGKDITRFWTHDQIEPEGILFVVWAVWLVLEASGNCVAVLLNGTGIVRQQVYVVSAFVVLALPLKLWMAPTYGAAGVVAAGIIAYILANGGGYGIVFRKALMEKLR